MDWLKDNGIFLPMLNDAARSEFYKKAIAKVANGKTFVDAGAGTGFLSYIAVQHGAKKVYAVEQDKDRYLLLCNIIKKLNLEDKIFPVHADFLTTNFEADYCVTETIGGQIFDENIFSIGQHAKNLGMKLIPETIELCLLVQHPHPIFFLAVEEHLQYELKLESSFNEFNSVVSDFIQIDKKSPMSINKIFPFLESLPEIKIENHYMSAPQAYDLGTKYKNILLTLPAEYAINEAIVTVVWFAKFMDVTLDSRNCIWALPAKRIVIPNKDMKLAYSFKYNAWWYLP